MSRLEVADLRVFAPTKDMQVSKAFYLALGWELKYDDGNLALLEIGDCRFYLNKHYTEALAHSFRFHLLVSDAQAWFHHVSAVKASDKQFSEVRVQPPKQEDYGALVTYVHDPSGLLIDFSQRTTQPASDWVEARIRNQHKLKGIH